MLTPNSTSATIFRQLDCVLRAVSTPTRLEMLTAVAKWRLLLEVLLGHPPIRGRSRPRDFPFAPHQDDALALAKSLARHKAFSTDLDKRGEAHPYRLYDWVSACALMGAEETDEARAEERIHVLLGELALKLAEADDHPFKPGKKANFDQRVLYLLGLPEKNQRLPKRGHRPDQPESNKKVKQGISREITKDAVVAAVVAFRAAAEPPRSDTATFIDDLWPQANRAGKFIRTTRERLASRALWRVQFKSANVQALLQSCTVTSIRRGASTWCAQTLGLLRDDLCFQHAKNWDLAPGQRPFLLVDSNAVVSFWSSQPIDAHRINGCVDAALKRATMETDGADDAGLDHRHPLLKEFRREALQVYATDFGHAPDARETALRSVFPDIKVQVTRMSLWAAASRTERYEKDYRVPAAQETKVLGFSSPQLKVQNSSPSRNAEAGRLSPGACTGRRGDPALPSRIPPWYKPGKGGKQKQQYGWAAFAYSLAGRVYRATTDRGLCLLAPDQLAAAPIQSEAPLARLEGIDQKLGGTGRRALIKFDGDRIGKHFVESPALSHTSASIAIESVVLDRVKAAVRAITEQVLKEVDPADALQHLPPINLIYFGGDDLELIIPQKLLQHFLRAFSAPLPNDPPLPLPAGMSWSAAAIELPAHVGHAPEIQAANHLETLLELAKSHSPFRNDGESKQAPTPPSELTGLETWTPPPGSAPVYALIAQLKPPAEP